MSTLMSASLAYERRIDADASQKTPRRTTQANKRPVPSLRWPMEAFMDTTEPMEGKTSNALGNQNSSRNNPGRAVALPDLNQHVTPRGMSSLPVNVSARDQPAMLVKLQKIIKDSGLFKHDDWEHRVDGERTPRAPSIARLDVLRVVFAIFCNSAKVFKPILCMIQREYEAHMNFGLQAKEKVDSLQKEQAAGYDSRQAAVEEMKARWKERLKRAHDAVTETKKHFDDLRERFDKQAERIADLETENATLRENLGKAETKCTTLGQENVRLQKTVRAHDFELQRINKVECEKFILDEQIHVLVQNVAEMKTNFEMQELKYQNTVKEHGRFKTEIRHLKSQMKEYHEERAGLSPRPEWKRITQFVAPLTQLPTVGPSANIARRIAADLTHALFMHRFAILGVEGDFGFSEVCPAFNGTVNALGTSQSTLEIPDAEEVSMPAALDRRPLLEVEPPLSNNGRASAPRLVVSSTASHLESNGGLSSPLGKAKDRIESNSGLSSPLAKAKARSPEQKLVKICPGLGSSDDVPIHLRSTSAVAITTLDTELETIMNDFWNFRIESNIQKEETSEQSMSDAFLAFLQQSLPSDQAALEASYSISIALTEAAKQDAEANLFLLCLLGVCDENCVHVQREIVESCREWTGHVESFLTYLAFKHPWVNLFAERIRHIAAAMEGRGSHISHASAVVSRMTSRAPSAEPGMRCENGGKPETHLLMAEETRDYLVQVVLELHVVHRRRLMQRFRNGLARATMSSLLDMGKPVSMVQELVEPMLKDIEPNLDEQDMQIMVNVGLSKRMYKEQLTPAQQLRVGVRSLKPFHKFLGVAKTMMADQMWMSMDELDHAVNDPRVAHLMQNFLRFLTPSNASPVNRVLAKLEAAV